MFAKRHAVELHDLTADELRLFSSDVAAVGRTLTSLFAPAKLDNLVMGHLCPHVHCHVYPQYAHDDPGALIDVQASTTGLPADEWNARLTAIRTTSPATTHNFRSALTKAPGTPVAYAQNSATFPANRDSAPTRLRASDTRPGHP